ncbi:unnamed protein product [Cyclocybe aegerita]|uniref:Uncharacterized protein n=1 Tax=Cyclocybe aegerita TaxID=1973307 RepID=A0A8S0VSA8_CYCAE|nr:unnamed protein product [Cyclocybe aegerita]
MSSTHTKNLREVNNLLHNLRGEQFRHRQNVAGSREHISALRNYNSPSLPVRLADLEHGPSPAVVAPAALQKRQHSPTETLTKERLGWHRQALNLVASHLGGFPDPLEAPSLSLLCLQTVLSHCSNSAEFKDGVVPFIPHHLRRDLVRYCAIQSPLPTWKLDAIFEPHGHADGEILVVGSEASLREDHFSQHQPHSPEEDITWEQESSSSSLHTLVLLSTCLSTSTILTLPPTITTLALINLPSSIPLHRLPKLCPLLVFLDLSYNSWLQHPGSNSLNSLERVEWPRWNNLRVLGLRGCYVSEEVLRKVNQGRWDDVEIVRYNLPSIKWFAGFECCEAREQQVLIT